MIIASSMSSYSYAEAIPTVKFTLEKSWADGPPAVEGSPIELALSWVTELTEPFYVSPEVLVAAKTSSNPRNNCSQEGSEK